MRTKIQTAKYGGNDAYSWAVFVNGRPVATGCSRTEAAYHKRQITEIYAQREGWTP